MTSLVGPHVEATLCATSHEFDNFHNHMNGDLGLDANIEHFRVRQILESSNAFREL